MAVLCRGAWQGKAKTALFSFHLVGGGRGRGQKGGQGSKEGIENGTEVDGMGRRMACGWREEKGGFS